jgi:hypothetical protein
VITTFSVVVAAALSVAVCDASASAIFTSSLSVTLLSAGVNSAQLPGVVQLAGMLGAEKSAVAIKSPEYKIFVFISSPYLLSPMMTIGIPAVSGLA